MTAVLAPSSNSNDWHFTCQQYYKLYDAGFFGNNRVELIAGRIVRMSPQRVPHAMAIEHAYESLRALFPKKLFRIRCQLPFHVSNDSEPEPDFAIIDSRITDSPEAHPSEAVLVIEISESTLDRDRDKASLYALSGIREYWILNLVSQTLEVFRDPIPGGGPPEGPAYGSFQTLSALESISPLSSPQVSISVADLLP